MPQLELSTEKLAKYIFERRRTAVFDSIYAKILEDTDLLIKEKARGLAIDELKRHSTKTKDEAETEKLIMELEQLMYEELARSLSLEL